MLPLSGITVVDLSRLLPAPLTTLFMAQMGARVIKIEDPRGGDYLRWTPPLQGEYSAFFYLLNRGKESVTLNLKEERGREILRRIVRKADVLVESFRPGVMDSLGVGYEDLKGENPGLIYCAVSGYGYTETDFRSRAGHDLNYVSLNGIAALNGTRKEGPRVPGVQIADIAGGSYMALIAILAALLKRERSGKGEFLDISMTHGSMPLAVMGFGEFLGTGKSPGPEEYTLNGLYPCYRIYRAKDGYVSLAALEPKFWQNFCEAVDRRDLLDKAFATGEEGEAVMSELEGIFGERSVEEWARLNGEYDFCCEPVNDFQRLLRHPLVEENDVLGVDEEGRGYVRLPVSSLRVEKPGSVPRLGENTADVLREFVGDIDIEELKRDGII